MAGTGCTVFNLAMTSVFVFFNLSLFSLCARQKQAEMRKLIHVIPPLRLRRRNCFCNWNPAYMYTASNQRDATNWKQEYPFLRGKQHFQCFAKMVSYRMNTAFIPEA